MMDSVDQTGSVYPYVTHPRNHNDSEHIFYFSSAGGSAGGAAAPPAGFVLIERKQFVHS